jgi:hypothetical protein
LPGGQTRARHPSPAAQPPGSSLVTITVPRGADRRPVGPVARDVARRHWRASKSDRLVQPWSDTGSARRSPTRRHPVAAAGQDRPVGSRRAFAEAWQRDMATRSRRETHGRRGQATHRLVRYADDFVVMVAGTQGTHRGPGRRGGSGAIHRRATPVGGQDDDRARRRGLRVPRSPHPADHAGVEQGVRPHLATIPTPWSGTRSRLRSRKARARGEPDSVEVARPVRGRAGEPDRQKRQHGAPVRSHLGNAALDESRRRVQQETLGHRAARLTRSTGAAANCSWPTNA